MNTYGFEGPPVPLVLVRPMSGDRPPHYLPAVGRHTDILEGERKDPASERETKGTAQGGTSIRRPSVSETPDFKKAKLGEVDVSMSNAGDSGTGDISPGQSIEATATQHDISQGDLDVEIPEVEQANSPSFASQAADIPHFAGLLTKGPEHVDLTEEDARLEAAENQDELQTARTRQDVVGVVLPVSWTKAMGRLIRCILILLCKLICPLGA